VFEVADKLAGLFPQLTDGVVDKIWGGLKFVVAEMLSGGFPTPYSTT